MAQVIALNHLERTGLLEMYTTRLERVGKAV